jgi:hypothetical protein
LNGLSNNFTGKIVCSPETKKLLLQLEEEKSHINVSKGNTEIGRRKYSGLQDNPPVVPIVSGLEELDVDGFMSHGHMASPRSTTWVTRTARKSR